MIHATFRIISILNKMDHFCNLFPTVCKQILFLHKNIIKLFVSKREWSFTFKKSRIYVFLMTSGKMSYDFWQVFEKNTLDFQNQFFILGASFWHWLRYSIPVIKIFVACYYQAAVITWINILQFLKKAIYLEANYDDRYVFVKLPELLFFYFFAVCVCLI